MAETIALVGGETLLGKEVRDVLGETALGQQLRLVAGAEEETGTLTEVGGLPAFLAKLDPDAVEDAAIVILAGSAESSKAALDAHRAAPHFATLLFYLDLRHHTATWLLSVSYSFSFRLSVRREIPSRAAAFF